MGTTDLNTALQNLLRASAKPSDPWLAFDRFMTAALYAPALGYYSRSDRQIGPLPARQADQAGSDFVTAPEISDLFGRALARQVAQALAQTGTDTVYEFGPGRGTLAAQVLGELDALGAGPVRYRLIELSAQLRAQQQQRLAAWGDRVQWLHAWPEVIEGVVLGNELLDALPVQLLHRIDGVWHERGVVWADGSPPGVSPADPPGWRWQDRPTALRPPIEPAGAHDYLTEIHPQAQAWVAELGRRLLRGGAFLIDYGFPAAEYYHPQRSMGTLMCHHQHRADTDPLSDVGDKDITAHVDFTGVALAANAAGLGVLGYTSQAWFLLNCGLDALLAQADRVARIRAQPLLLEHEMGELFKVIGLYAGPPWDAIGFAQGDRTHCL